MLRRLLCKQTAQFSKFLFYSEKYLNFYSTMGSKSALVLLAEGTEEMEAVITVDVLRRGMVNVTVGGLSGGGAHVCSRQVKVVPDVSLEDAVRAGPYDVVVLPGGLAGSKAFAESASVGSVLTAQEQAGRTIAAICAAPTALKAHSVGLGKKVTCYPAPALEDDMKEGDKYQFVRQRVVVDGNLITSQGPGTAFEFALAIVEHLNGKPEADKVAAGLVLPNVQ